MSEFKIIEVKQSVLENNDRDAELLRSELKACHTFLLNLMSSPGSGKTTTLCRTIEALYVWRRNPNMKIIPICARTGEGIQEWADWLREQTRAWIK